MAETRKGHKFVKVEGYVREQDGKPIKVRPHDRSTPKDSKGKQK